MNKGTKTLDYRDLTGPEKLKVFCSIKVSEIMGQSDDAEYIQVVWNDFFHLINELDQNYISENCIIQIKGEIDA